MAALRIWGRNCGGIMLFSHRSDSMFKTLALQYACLSNTLSIILSMSRSFYLILASSSPIYSSSSSFCAVSTFLRILLMISQTVFLMRYDSQSKRVRKQERLLMNIFGRLLLRTEKKSLAFLKTYKTTEKLRISWVIQKSKIQATIIFLQ